MFEFICKNFRNLGFLKLVLTSVFLQAQEMKKDLILKKYIFTQIAHVILLAKIYGIKPIM
ncbi:hypothetical protein RT99_13490 [Flavobacterium sp. MEB061]|nr:hypothetical protein RT99_13490 [Flavobacterium sp. MEB061]